jgi:hypothetical protein
MSSPPAILLAFANDWVDDNRHLRGLYEESKAIVEALSPVVEAGAVSVPPPIHNATVDDVLGAFRERTHRDRICIFHFGGHASGSKLMFEDEAGAQTPAHAGGLAGYLGRQRGLVLVFLNGCCTEGQVRRLRAAGVKAVVATTVEIEDRVAAELAAAFYAELATRTLRDAFETAEYVVRTRWGDDPQAVTRDVEPHNERGAPQWPWIIDCDPAYEGWTLASEREPAHLWRRRFLVAASAASLLLTAALIASDGARRAACRAPGMRSFCAAVGIGDVPTPEEQALWDDALGQNSGDGLRAYLRTYPRGTYADEARSRLDGCRIEETLGPEREVRFVLTVNPIRARPLSTEDEARRDAVARGQPDADTTCKPQEGPSRLRSVRVEPRDWRCDRDGRGFTCGFDGEIVCRVQSRIRSEQCR